MIQVIVTKELNGYTLSNTDPSDEMYVAETVESMQKILVGLLHDAPQQVRKDNE